MRLRGGDDGGAGGAFFYVSDTTVCCSIITLFSSAALLLPHALHAGQRKRHDVLGNSPALFLVFEFQVRR